MPATPHKTGERESGRLVTAARSKIIILNGTLAVGFSRYIKEGVRLFVDLERRFKARTPTKDELAKALKSWNFAFHKKASVVRWLANPEPCCFTWSAAYGADISWPERQLIGSGSRHFGDILTNDYGRYTGPNLAGKQLSEFVAVTKTNKMLTLEMMNASTLANHYGYYAEIVQWDGAAFQFIPKLTSVFLNVFVARDGTLTTLPAMVRVYERKDRFSLVQTSHKKDHKGPDGKVGPHVFVELITPIHDDGEDIPWPSTTLEPRSPITTFNLCWMAENGRTGVGVVAAGPDEFDISGDETKFEIKYEINPEVKSQLYEAAYPSGTQSPSEP